MRVMSFNVRSDSFFDGKNRWNYRKQHVVNLLEEFKGDVIGLQEVTPMMLEDLKVMLSSYHIVGQPRSTRYFSEHNNILISKKHTILSEDTFWLSKNPSKTGSSVWFSVFPRICTTVKVQLDTGELVRIYNTHLDVYLSPARTYGMRRIMERIKNFYNQEHVTVILMGDFNSGPKDTLIKKIIPQVFDDKKFVAVQETNLSLYNQPTMGRFKDKEKGMHLDYIFVSEECEVAEVEILKKHYNGQFPSDHYPICAAISVRME